jgi:hypothetical protein
MYEIYIKCKSEKHGRKIEKMEVWMYHPPLLSVYKHDDDGDCSRGSGGGGEGDDDDDDGDYDDSDHHYHHTY